MFNCNMLIASLSVTEWVSDHIETQPPLPIWILVVGQLGDVCFSFCCLLTALKVFTEVSTVKKLFSREISLNYARPFSNSYLVFKC